MRRVKGPRENFGPSTRKPTHSKSNAFRALSFGVHIMVVSITSLLHLASWLIFSMSVIALCTLIMVGALIGTTCANLWNLGRTCLLSPAEWRNSILGKRNTGTVTICFRCLCAVAATNWKLTIIPLSKFWNAINQRIGN